MIDNSQVAMKQAETMEKSNCALRADRDAQEEEIRFWQQRTLKGEMVRRKLHNTILEIKGNIRVFCRIRPLLGESTCAIHGVKNAMNVFPSQFLSFTIVYIVQRVSALRSFRFHKTQTIKLSSSMFLAR